MNITEAKEVLETVGYPVSGHDWDDVIKELHEDYRVTAVGGSMNTLGDAAPLFMRSGNVAHMVDNKDDLFRACVRIKQIAKAREGAKTVVIPKDVYAFNLKTIKQALDAEVSHAERMKRDLSCADESYLVSSHDDTKLLRNTQQVMDDLMSDDKKLNIKAVEAFKAILIINRA